MKRLISLACAVLLSVNLCTAYATEDMSSDVVTSEMPVSSELISSEEPSSAPDEGSSEPELSSEISSEISSEQPVISSEEPDEPESNDDTDRPVSFAEPDDGNDGNRGAIILVFCYIITALIGVCLVGLIIANVYIPIANKKRELASLSDDEPEDDYVFGKHSPKGKKQKRRPSGKM